MLRSFKTLTGALCLFAYATTAYAPAAMAVSSGSEPLLHIIDPEKKAEAAPSATAVGSGSEPLLHIIEPEKKAEEPKAASKKASSKKVSSKKAASKKTASSKSSSKKGRTQVASLTGKEPVKSTKTVKHTVTKAEYAKLIRKAAAKHGVPVKIARAVVEVESNFNPRARGSAGEVGLMQIKPATARGIGYRGSTKALYDPETNLEWGMKYLAGAHKRANGDLCGTILRYNAGHFAKRMNPVSRRYCTKVKRIMASS